MEKITYYWLYKVTIVTWRDLVNTKEEVIGVVAAKNLIKAVKKIESYYGDDILEINHIKPISEDVLELNIEKACYKNLSDCTFSFQTIY